MMNPMSKLPGQGFFKTTVSGIITEEKELAPSLPIFDENDESFELEMEYRFYVEPVTGKRDLEYQVDASLKRHAEGRRGSGD